MAIKRQVPTWEGGTQHLVMPAFSFATNDAAADGLADMILEAWQNSNYTSATNGTTKPLRDALLDRDDRTGLPTQVAIDFATDRVNDAGFYLKRAVVITETEHDNDYVMQSDDEIVFVLPWWDRIPDGLPAGTDLTATAKLLMACTPNGI
jgi:hypothetical protein